MQSEACYLKKSTRYSAGDNNGHVFEDVCSKTFVRRCLFEEVHPVHPRGIPGGARWESDRPAVVPSRAASLLLKHPCLRTYSFVSLAFDVVRFMIATAYGAQYGLRRSPHIIIRTTINIIIMTDVEMSREAGTYQGTHAATRFSRP